MVTMDVWGAAVHNYPGCWSPTVVPAARLLLLHAILSLLLLRVLSVLWRCYSPWCRSANQGLHLRHMRKGAVIQCLPGLEANAQIAAADLRQGKQQLGRKCRRILPVLGV